MKGVNAVNKMKAEEITKGSTLLATLSEENYPFGMHKDLIDDLHRMINVALNIPVVSHQRELVCPTGYYPNIASTGMECIHCGRGKYAH